MSLAAAQMPAYTARNNEHIALSSHSQLWVSPRRQLAVQQRIADKPEPVEPVEHIADRPRMQRKGSVEHTPAAAPCTADTAADTAGRQLLLHN